MRLYVREHDSSEVVAIVSKLREPVPLVFLHEIEIANALHRCVFEERLARKQCEAATGLFRQDIDAGLYRRTAIDVTALTKQAVEISEAWTARDGTRALDVLHVAAAKILGANRFLTGDARQRQLARSVGLSV